MTSQFSSVLLTWYEQRARQLPWRNNPTPYPIWVSEIMLQQTQVETVIPYFKRWLKRFPSVQALAEASQQDVLSIWEGLGYYSRARNLHLGAQIVQSEYGGFLPSDIKELQKLPGIGRYTAAAIASIAFGKDEPTLDGNIRRVLSRLFDLQVPARSPQGEKQLWEWAAVNLPCGRAGEYNQALMDLGALVCTPRQPDCPHCPLSSLCQSFALGIQEERPIRETKRTVPHYIVTAAVILMNNKVLLAQRPLKGLLGGMWEFPGGKLNPGEDLVSCLQREIKEEIDVEIVVLGELGVYKHAYTHFRVTLHAFSCELAGGEPQRLVHNALTWVNLLDLESYPMGKIDRQIANALQKTPLLLFESHSENAYR
jgi:A/G-specific adenine glycosylase